MEYFCPLLNISVHFGIILFKLDQNGIFWSIWKNPVHFGIILSNLVLQNNSLNVAMVLFFHNRESRQSSQYKALTMPENS